jgi:hypothetical protein
MARAVLAGCMVAPGIQVPVLLALMFAMGLISPFYQGVRFAVLAEGTATRSCLCPQPHWREKPER